MATKTLDAAIAARKKVTDGAYVPIMQTDGTLAQIAMADLAKVAGGLKRVSSPVFSDTKTYCILTKQENMGAGTYMLIGDNTNNQPFIVIFFIQHDNAFFTHGILISNTSFKMYYNNGKNKVYLTMPQYSRCSILELSGNSFTNVATFEESNIDVRTLSEIKQE